MTRAGFEPATPVTKGPQTLTKEHVIIPSVLSKLGASLLTGNLAG
jgi:hypothetical protein